MNDNNMTDTPRMNAQTPGDDTSLLDVLSRDLKRLMAQKARDTGGVEARTLQAIAFAEGEQYVDYKGRQLLTEAKEENRLYLVFNLIGRRVSKLIGRLSAIDPPYKVQPDRKDPRAYGYAEIGDQLIMALDQKLDQPSRNWEILYWLIHGGTAFEYTPWVPNASIEPTVQYAEDGTTLLFQNLQDGSIVPQEARDQAVAAGTPPELFKLYEKAQLTGDVGSIIYGPLNVFIDQGCKSVEDLGPDQRIYIVEIKTLGWIKENFKEKRLNPATGVTEEMPMDVEADKNFKIVSTAFVQTMEATAGTFLQDLIPLIQGTNDSDDTPMTVVAHGYAPPSTENPRGRYTCFQPGKKILLDDECPYGEVPIMDYHWRPVTTTFWTGNFIQDLIAPQRFLNRRLSQLGEQSNASLYSNLLLGGSLDAVDIPADRPGVVKGGLSEDGTPMVGRMEPPQIPDWFMATIEFVIKMFNDIAGGQDLMEEHRFPGQLRGPMAVPMLQEIMDTEWGPFFKHFAERTARVKQMRLNRVKQYYPAVRTMNYVSRTQQDEVLEFHAEEVLRSDVNLTVTVQPGVILPELRALREARVRERLQSPLAILYMDERTGRPDKSKIAADLQFGDAGREAKEAQYRKLQTQLNKMLWEGKPVPPVQPFYDHAAMMDELEAEMATTEYLHSSPQIQQFFIERWTQHKEYLMKEAEARQRAMESGMIQNAVAQATQQAAAKAAADAVTSTQEQVDIQSTMQSSGETRRLVTAAQGRAAQPKVPVRRRPPMPFTRGPERGPGNAPR